MPLAWQTAREAAGLHAPAWALGFAAHHMRARATNRFKSAAMRDSGTSSGPTALGSSTT